MGLPHPASGDTIAGMEILTATAAVVAAVTGLWNVYQFSMLKGRVDSLEAGHNAHVNAPGLHR